MLRLPGGAVVTGRSAAQVWGVRQGNVDDPVEILTPTQIRQVTGTVVHVGSIGPTVTTTRNGVAVSKPMHTAWEIARRFPMLEAVPWIDGLAYPREFQTSALLQYAALHMREFGSTRALRTLALCDWRAESPPESIVRTSLVLGGLPVPIPQYRIVIDQQFLARVDLAYPALQLALEYDGHWHADAEQLTRDRRRIRNLNAAGWYVYPITRHDLRDLDALVAGVRAIVRKRSRNI